MFVGFNLTNYEFNSVDYYMIGDKVFNINKDIIRKELDDFISIDGCLDGSKMQEYWFPQINADIFISHSHNDLEKAKTLAGWIYHRFKLSVFIDSCVWGYADDLLKKIDNKYCYNVDTNTYDYTKRNHSTSHVYMMLSTALTMMIDKSESIIFLNTPNSISTSEIVSQTKSPWIYSELAMTKLVRNKNLKEYRREKIEKSFVIAEQEKLEVKYNVNLEHLVKLSNDDLKNWNLRYNKEEYPLDILYDLKNLFKEPLLG